MTQEHAQTPSTDSAKKLPHESADPQAGAQPSALLPADLFALPRAGMPHKLHLFQRAAGNRAVVQRLLNTNVIQREGETTPIPPLADVEARRLLALSVLKKAYGGLIKQEPRVTEVKGIAAMQTLYDQSMIRQNKVYREGSTERPWQVGDAARRGDMNKDFPGFYDAGGNIVLDTEKAPDEQTATLAHEMLHANSNGEVVSTFGKDVDEGITESLTQKAFKKAGYSAPGGYFVSNMEWVARLSGLFGENTVMYSYFNGVAPLRSMMNTTLDDEDAFDTFARAVRAKEWKDTHEMFDRWERAVNGTEIDKKIGAVTSRLDQFWVDDEDITAVENIFAGSSSEEQVSLKQVISPRIGNMSDHGHRARLRILTG